MQDTVEATHTTVIRIDESLEGVKKDVSEHRDTLYDRKTGIVYKVHDHDRTIKALTKIGWILVTTVLGGIVITLLR